MGDIKVDSFINHYPLSLLCMSEDVIEDRNLNIKEKEFLYETPTINFNSCLNNKNTIKDYLEKYMVNTEKLADEYIDTNHPYNMFNDTFDLVVICEIYIQRVYEGIGKKPKKVLSIQDGDGIPTYFLKGITPNFFRSPFKIRAKACVYIID